MLVVVLVNKNFSDQIVTHDTFLIVNSASVYCAMTPLRTHEECIMCMVNPWGLALHNFQSCRYPIQWVISKLVLVSNLPLVLWFLRIIEGFLWQKPIINTNFQHNARGWQPLICHKIHMSKQKRAKTLLTLTLKPTLKAPNVGLDDAIYPFTWRPISLTLGKSW